MRKIPLSLGLLSYLEDLEHTEAALLADDDAKVLAAPFTSALDDWQNVFKKERAARREVIRAEAVVAVRNEQLDATTMQFAHTARGVAPALLDKVFTMAPGRFIRTALRKQAERTINVIVVEIGKLDPQSPLLPFGAKLQGFAQGAIQALDNRATLKGTNAVTANDVDEWKEGINSLRLLTWTELLKIADAKGYPRSWAEAFFRRSEDDEKKSADEPAAPAAPAAPTPAAPAPATP